MKTTLLLASMAFAITAFSQAQNKPDFFGENLRLHTAGTTTLISLKDSSYWYSSWSKATISWDYIHRNIYSYNALYEENGNISSNSTGSGWLNEENAKNYVYDSNHRLLEVTFEGWNSGWSDYYKHSYTYDTAGNLLTKIEQVWLSGAWRNSYLSTFTYSGNNQTSALYRYWDMTSNSWTNSMRTTSVYSGNQLTSSTDEDWNASSWTNSMRRSNFIYSGTDLLSYEFEMWDAGTGTFELKTKSSFTYDGNHHMLTSSLENWDATASLWEKSMRTDYSYDAQWNQTQVMQYGWDTSTGTWENGSLIVNYYTTGTVGIHERPDDNNRLMTYPNPCTDQITVLISGKSSSTFHITDLSGKVVLSGETTEAGPLHINTRTLEAGLYIIEIRSEESSSKGKFIRN